MRTGLWRKGIGVGVAGLLVLLTFAVLLPDAAAVLLSPGVPDQTSVASGTAIVFGEVVVTIRAAEAIPVNFLVFRIFDATTDREVSRVHFSLQGDETYDLPVGAFTVETLTNTEDLPYQQKGWFYGYDEETGEMTTKYRHGFGYGYGYASPDLVLEYRITYTTCQPGTFYAKLFVKSPKHTFISGESISFTVFPSTPPTHHCPHLIGPRMPHIWEDAVQILTNAKEKKK